MARDLKLFSYILHLSGKESEELGQPRHVRQGRAYVATTTKKEAIEKFGITTSEARDYMSESHADVAFVLEKPGQVFVEPLDRPDDRWIEVTRTPHVPRKRRKVPTYEEKMAAWAARAALKFTDEELQYLADMFERANDPVALSIARKACGQLAEMRA